MKIEHQLTKATKYELLKNTTYGFYCASVNDAPLASTTITLYDSTTDYFQKDKAYIKLAEANTPELACSFCNEFGSILPPRSISDGIHRFLEKGQYNSNNTDLLHDYLLYEHFQIYQVTMYHLLHIYNLIHLKKRTITDLCTLFHHCIDIMINPYFNNHFHLEYDNPTAKDEMQDHLKAYPLIKFIHNISTYPTSKKYVFNLYDKETNEPILMASQPEYNYKTLSYTEFNDSLHNFPKSSFIDFISTMIIPIINSTSTNQEYVKAHETLCIQFAKYVFSEFLSYFIRDTIPRISFDSFDNISSWKFSSLANAIFFYFYMDCSNGNTYKVCANEYCKKLFAFTPGYKNKIYCSPNCAHKVANRKWKNKSKNTNKSTKPAP